MRILGKLLTVSVLSLVVTSCGYIPKEWGIEESLNFFTENKETVELEKKSVIYTDFSPEINQFFTNARKGESKLFANSPWGSDALITVERLYYSAAGKNCREITITLDNTSLINLTCLSSAENWVAVRPVTKANKITQ